MQYFQLILTSLYHLLVFVLSMISCLSQQKFTVELNGHSIVAEIYYMIDLLYASKLTTLSWISVHNHASAHPQILTVVRFFKVLRVTAHHVKFLRSEFEGRSAALWAHDIRH